MFLREGNLRKEKRLEYFNRDPSSLLLIDSNPLSEQLNPTRTVLVESMKAADEKRKQLVQQGQKPPADNTCFAIKALVMRVREDSMEFGDVNVPRALHRLYTEAKKAGFSTDAQGLYSYLNFAAEQEVAQEKARRESGLGGFFRRLLSNSGVLRGSLTTVETNSCRNFRDPAYDLDEDSILASKWKAAAGRMFRPQQPGMA
jgi:hypothetical protein